MPWLLTWLACASPPPAPPVEVTPAVRPDLVLIVWEATRADHVSAYGYGQRTTPNLELLAQEAVRFDRHSATAPWTRPSVVSMLSGLSPSAHGVRTWEDALSSEVPWLAEELQAAGYHTALIASNAYFEQEPGLRRGFDWYHGVDATSGQGLSVDVLTWLDGRPKDQPTFLYVHLYDPHCPYTPSDAAERMFWPLPEALRRPQRYTLAQWNALNGCYQLPWNEPNPNPDLDLDVYRAAWQAEVYEADHVTGMLLERLRAAGLLDHSLVAVTADHGEEFMEHGGHGHGTTLFQEVLHVPLLVRPPGGLPGGRVEAALTSGVDLAATFRAAAGLPAPREAEGIDLSPAWKGGALPTDRIVYAETDDPGTDDGGSRARVARQGDLKLLLDLDNRKGTLYDLAADPGETRDLGAEAAAARSTLGQALAEHDRRATGVAGQREQVRRVLDKRTTEALIRMGYLE